VQGFEGHCGKFKLYVPFNGVYDVCVGCF